MSIGSIDIDELLSDYNAKELLIAIDRADCAESFVEFIKRSWHIIEPGRQYVHNWHIDLIAAHLEAITDETMIDEVQYYNRLLINVPPGAMKSLLVNVFWPAWEWGPKNKPHLRYVCSSHSLSLAARDSTKMRRLIQSDWYQERWGNIVTLTGDQNAKLKFENTATGFREAIASGSITGSRGDRVLIDDPHSVESANSDQMRKTTIEWFTESVPTRVNDSERSAIIVIMQRLHEEDVSGVILEKKMNYDHIMIPMEFDPSRAKPTLLGYQDPRTEVGELYFESRFPQYVVERDKKVLGPYAVSGQFQQTPSPLDGGIIKQDWWQLWDQEKYPAFDYIVAALDTAYTAKTENDPSAMTVWGVFTEDPKAIDVPALNSYGASVTRSYYPDTGPKVMMAYAWQAHLQMPELIEKVLQTMTTFKVDAILIENKAVGIPVENELRRIYASKNFQIISDNPQSLDKPSRLIAIQHLFAEKMIYAPDRSWADMVINQTSVFPKGKHDDLVDTVSMALRYLRRIGLLQRQEEFTESQIDSMTYRGAGLAPLYPV